MKEIDVISRYQELIRLSLREITELNRKSTDFACPILSKKKSTLIHIGASRILYFALHRSNNPHGEGEVGIAIIMYPWRINFGFGQDLGIYTRILKFIGANTLFL